MDITKTKAIFAELAEAVKEIEKKHGVSFSRGNGKYSDTDCYMKVTFTDNDINGDVKTPEATAFENYADHYGLQKSDLNKTFTQRGETFKIVGLKTRSHKYPILCKKVSNGKGYKFPSEDVVRLLGA